MNKGHVAEHSFKVVLKCITDDKYAPLNAKDKNIILWASLLHDISKRSGEPLIKGKDHIHPFISGATTLKIFEKLGFIKLQTDEEMAAFLYLIELIESSVQPIHNLYPKFPHSANLCLEIHSH